jgi:hypothetical protein
VTSSAQTPEPTDEREDEVFTWCDETCDEECWVDHKGEE